MKEGGCRLTFTSAVTGLYEYVTVAICNDRSNKTGGKFTRLKLMRFVFFNKAGFDWEMGRLTVNRTTLKSILFFVTLKIEKPCPLVEHHWIFA